MLPCHAVARSDGQQIPRMLSRSLELARPAESLAATAARATRSTVVLATGRAMHAQGRGPPFPSASPCPPRSLCEVAESALAQGQDPREGQRILVPKVSMPALRSTLRRRRSSSPLRKMARATSARHAAPRNGSNVNIYSITAHALALSGQGGTAECRRHDARDELCPRGQKRRRASDSAVDGDGTARYP